MTEIQTSVYSAYRGYAWSRIPDGLTEPLMDSLREQAAARRGDFPDPDAVEAGVVARGPVAAAFAIRSVPGWDSAGRASEYAAFAFFKAADAAELDFGELLAHPFFATPTREPSAALDYRGRSAAVAPLTAAGQLVCRHHLASIPAAQGGDLLAKYFGKSDRWGFRLNADGTLSVDCAEWRSAK